MTFHARRQQWSVLYTVIYFSKFLTGFCLVFLLNKILSDVWITQSNLIKEEENHRADKFIIESINCKRFSPFRFVSGAFLLILLLCNRHRCSRSILSPWQGRSDLQWTYMTCSRSAIQPLLHLNICSHFFFSFQLMTMNSFYCHF